MINVGALIDRVTTLKDKTLRITIACNELPFDTMSKIFSLNQKFCYVAIKEENFLNEEIKAIESLKTDDFEKGKTPSQRLRRVMFLVWTTDKEGFDDFNSYYINKMERLIDHFKAKLD